MVGSWTIWFRISISRGGIVGRRFRAEQQDLGADHVAGDRRADIDRVEEAVAGGVGDDGEGQMAVGRMEVLGAGGFLGGILEAVAADRLLDAAGLGEGVRYAKRKRRGACRERDSAYHGCPPIQPNGPDVLGRPFWCAPDTSSRRHILYARPAQVNSRLSEARDNAVRLSSLPALK